MTTDYYKLQSFTDESDIALCVSEFVNVCKRRPQAVKLQTSLFDVLAPKILEIQDPETFINFAEEIIKFSAGKIYLEKFHGKIIKKLAIFYENVGKIEKSQEIIEKVSPEIFQSFDEKIDFLFLQIEIFIKNSDFLKAKFALKKIDEEKIKENPEILENFYKKTLEIFDEKSFEKIETFFKLAKMENLEIPERNFFLEESVKNILSVKISEKFEGLKNQIFEFCCEKKNISAGIFLNEKLFIILEKLCKNELIFDDFEDSEINSRILEKNLIIFSNFYEKVSIKFLCEILRENNFLIEKTLISLKKNSMIKFLKIDEKNGEIFMKNEDNFSEKVDTWNKKNARINQLFERSVQLINSQK